MTDEFSTPLLDEDGKLRLRRFMIATVASAIVIAIGVTFGMYAADPDGGWGAATGVGAMIGFWMSPLAGAVCGNGFHEVMKERTEKEDEATEVTLSHAHPVPA